MHDWNSIDSLQTDEKLEQYEKPCRDHDHVELEIPQKAEIIFNRETNKIMEVARNILKHSLQNNSLRPFFVFVSDFETTIVETHYQ